MNHFTPPTGRRARQAILLSALLAASAGAHAATQSGTAIDNTATLTYSVGTVPQAPINSDPASFVVDKKVDVSVTTADTTPGVTVIPGQNLLAAASGDPVLKFTVANDGNDTQDIYLTADNKAASTWDFVFTSDTSVGSDFQTSSCTIYLDDGNGTLEPGAGDDIPITFINDLAPGTTATVLVRCGIPTAAKDGEQAVVALIAEVRDTNGNTLANGSANGEVDTVFADDFGPDDAASPTRDAKHSERSAYNVVTSALAVTKAVTTICDPVNGTLNPKNIPGAYVQYAITVSNASTTAATLTQVQDTLVSELAFDGELISGGTGTAAECASGGPSLSASGFGVVSGTGTSSHTAPGSAGDAVTTGASVSGQDVAINYSTLSKDNGATTVLTGGVLPGNNYITVYFNAIIQ